MTNGIWTQKLRAKMEEGLSPFCNSGQETPEHIFLPCVHWRELWVGVRERMKTGATVRQPADTVSMSRHRRHQSLSASGLLFKANAQKS